MPDYLTTTRVNLRSRPQILPETLMVTLSENTTVIKSGVSDLPEWWKVNVPSIGIDGFIHSKYLEEKTNGVPEVVLEPIVLPIVDLPVKASIVSKRNSTGARAYPLNEPGMPDRIMESPSTKISSIHNIISWLNVETSARYGPTDKQTYCNIYAYDFCRLCGVYIPRVWWTRTAIASLVKEVNVSPIYANTVTELNANSLYDWFVEFSSVFGWRRVYNLNEIQSAVTDNGNIGIIVGQRLNLNNSGHITCVVPETPTIKAERNGAGNVIRPLQSQAGRNNHKYFVGNWWSNPDKFKAFGFWICE